MAGMPAALRNSIRAAGADGVTPINRELGNCIVGTVTNACNNNQDYPLTLFSPTISMDSSGQPMGLLPITAPLGSAQTKRFDSFGVPCEQVSPECPFLVSTTFRAQCPPSPLPASPPPPTDPAFLALFNPKATCTIAEAVTVIFMVQVDPAAVAANPALGRFGGSVTGSITTSVKQVFGNDPQ